jgi:hypothetical protein
MHRMDDYADKDNAAIDNNAEDDGAMQTLTQLMSMQITARHHRQQ